MNKIECPICGNLIQYSGKPYEGQYFTCTACESMIEVIMTDPIELDVYQYEGEELVFGINSPNNHANKDMIRCTQCKKMIYPPKKLWVGDLVTCFACGAEHQVVGLNPIVLDIPYDGSDIDFMDEDFEGSPYDLYKEL
jgi:DNA-directed RNA polymerase subunit M/transcription elongation factor TFIIS